MARFTGELRTDSGQVKSNSLSSLQLWRMRTLVRATDPVFEAVGRVFSVFLRRNFQLAPFFGAQDPRHPGGRPQNQRPGRNLGPLGDQGIGAEQTAFADHGAIQDDCAHADQHFVPNRAGVHDRRMADGDVVADQARKVSGHVHHRLVLDVGVVADHDPVDVTAENGVKPDARMVANSNITDDHRALGQINALPDRGLALEKMTLWEMDALWDEVKARRPG